MSNSIWHKAGFHEAIDNKLKASKDGKWIYWTMYGWNIPGEDVHDIGVEWAYLEDIIAQADKAERLQKQLNATKKYADSLRNRVEKMLKKNKTLKNTAADYFMKSIELGIELEKTKSNN